jgi:hypothetical protein
MNTRKFLETVWPPRGPYCIATPWVRPDGKKVYAQHGCDSLDDAMICILKHKRSTDVYFAPHALKAAREVVPETGKLKTFRTHANMREARAFFFDIDAGEHYADQADILGALEKFLFATCLPAPLVVSSGHGIHVYWIADAPMESAAWREPAARLFWLAQRHGLHVDPARTTDQSSVLRVPGTFNFKNPDDPRKVTVLAEGAPGAEFLARLDAATEDFRKEAVGCGNEAVRRGPALAVAWDGRHPPADEVAAVCEHMRMFRDSRGNVSEPQWHAGIGTIKHCDDGAETVHAWSSGYPGYTAAETQAKLDAWTLPPPGCEKIDHNSGDPAVCNRCRHRDLAKNPVLIANLVYQRAHHPVPAPTAAPVVPVPLCQPPAPYILDMTYGIREKKNGLICEWPMFPVHWITATTNEPCLSRWYVKPLLGDWEQIEILNEELELRSLALALRNKNIIVSPKQSKYVQMFMLAYLKELQKHQTSLNQYDYVGWETAAPKLSETDSLVSLANPRHFIMYGRRIAVADGSVAPCIMTKNTQLDCMGRMGSLSRQIALMGFYDMPEYMPQQFAIGASLATPFFRYSNQHGMLVCLTGHTGSSKSTGAFFAASLWGHPELYPISGLRSNSTDKGRQERGAILRNQPFIVDEITLFENDVIHEIVLAASQAGSYISLKSNREFRQARGGYKSNLTICTSNKSLIQMINATNPGGQAGIMRVFEIKVSQNDARSKAEADDAMRQLVENYGWIGEDFLRKCLPHTQAIGAKFLQIQQELETDIHASQEERFMTACAATALLGIKLGRRLGYFPFSYRLMREWLIDEQIPAMRSLATLEREHQSPEAILNNYLEEIRPKVCRVDKNSRGEAEVLYTPPNNEIMARYDIFRAEVYARIKPFREYCNEHHYDYSDLLDRLLASGHIRSKSVKKRMQSERGTYSNPLPCFVVPIKSASPITMPGAPGDASRKVIEFKTR